ncbi:MAG TPA: DUF481 domain-containing protein [Gemmatimonadales bacterium]|nr:DUF481 domain-containing protein [Gemmatimonadales bacterium]
MIAALLLLAIQADTTKARPPAEVRFTGDIGYVATSGNSSVETLNLGDKVSAKVGDVILSQTFALVYGESKEKTVTSLYRGALRVDKGAKTAPVSVFGLLNYERNVFAGLGSRWSGASGLTVHLSRQGRTRVAMEGGISVTRQRGTATSGRDVDFLGGRAAGILSQHLTEKASVAQTIEVLPNFREPEDLRVNSESSLIAPLTGSIAIKLSYVIRYDGLPEKDYETTDRLFTSGIQLSL